MSTSSNAEDLMRIRDVEKMAEPQRQAAREAVALGDRLLAIINADRPSIAVTLDALTSVYVSVVIHEGLEQPASAALLSCAVDLSKKAAARRAAAAHAQPGLNTTH